MKLEANMDAVIGAVTDQCVSKPGAFVGYEWEDGVLAGPDFQRLVARHRRSM